jgi:hypothetical protein
MEPKKEEDDARLHELRLQLRLANQNAGKGTAAKLVLVSDMKKTQTFIRKLKALSDHPGASLVDDAQKLNLSKYVDEVCSVYSPLIHVFVLVAHCLDDFRWHLPWPTPNC